MAITLNASTITMNSGAGVQDPAGTTPCYFARAWVNFNGTGVIAIRASVNVSSLTDNNIGDYSVNFTTAMTDTNYCPVVVPNGTSAAYGFAYDANAGYTARATGSYRFNCLYSVNNIGGGGVIDCTNIYVAIFR